MENTVIKVLILITVTTLTAVGLSGCGNWAARQGYGTMTTALPCGQKLINVTWKGQEASLWTLTRPFRNGEVPETHRFKAKTTFGVFEGEVIITESTCS